MTVLKKVKYFWLFIAFIIALTSILYLFKDRIFTSKLPGIFLQESGIPANIVVDTNSEQGQVDPFWQNLSQGGEEKTFRLAEHNSQVKTLTPKYIRIDHIYDFYEPVKKINGQLSYDWTALDQAVNQIVGVGAIPFLSLSYMPPAISSGDITSPPQNWSDWSEVVRATVQHFSGKKERNLKNIIYEVWNEPDLFGNWKLYGARDYRTLYKYAVNGATSATNVNSFKIGGPAITAPYKNWVDNFLNYTVQNRIRIDFYSWHRYSASPTDYLIDINNVDTWLFKNGGLTLEKYLTEWGPISENTPLYDQNYAASHLIATTRQLLGRTDKTFIFEVFDGPNSHWGLLTTSSQKKPRFQALTLLNQVTGTRLELSGEGTWISGFAIRDNSKIRIILTNLDQTNRHSEIFPLTINNLIPGTYSYQETYLIGNLKKTIETINGSLNKQITLSANNIVLIEIELNL